MFSKAFQWARRDRRASPADRDGRPAQTDEEARAAGQAEALATLQAQHETLFSDYRDLRKRLRWHWASYPGSKRDWNRRTEGSDPFAERALALKARLVDLMAAPEFDAEDRRVTAVVTSCARHDLLQRTLESFFATSGPVHKMIVVEDGETEAEALKPTFAAWPIEWISTAGRVGQVQAIDLAYSRVETPYIFHIEDDYEFLRPGYIGKSMTVLQAEPMCLQVWLRGRPPADSHPFADEDRVSLGVPWRPVTRDRKNVWHGFSFNPGLRRLRDYRLIGSRFCDVVEPALGEGGRAEAQLSELYASVGYFAAALWEEDGVPFARHLGGRRHVR